MLERHTAEALAELYADHDQVIRIEVVCTGSCPAALNDVVLRSMQELVGNAVKHGFYARLVGCIRLELISGPRGTKLIVADDGWALATESGHGHGLQLVRALIEPLGGTLALRAGNGVTAEIYLRSAAPDGRVAALVAQDGRVQVWRQHVSEIDGFFDKLDRASRLTLSLGDMVEQPSAVAAEIAEFLYLADAGPIERFLIGQREAPVPFSSLTSDLRQLWASSSWNNAANRP